MDTAVKSGLADRHTSLPYRRFRPRLAFGHQEELQACIRQLTGLHPRAAEALLAETISAVEERMAQLRVVGLSSSDLAPTVRFSATLRVLRDLVFQGWTLREDDEGLILDSPGWETVRVNDPEPEKELLRRSFAFVRDAQLQQSATLEFITGIERRGVASLFADGNELANRLTEQGVNAIQPVLELIQPGARDQRSGLLLQDIWRYARHYWSIPYQSTPGRNMFYLIRDAAVEAKPLIGIAALGNPVLGLAQRDEFFGWSARGLRALLHRMSDAEKGRLATRLLDVLDDGIKEIYGSDLGVTTPQLDGDWRAVVAHLEVVEHDSAAARLRQLEEAGEKRSVDYLLIRAAHSAVQAGHTDQVDWELIARTSLYRRKRASTLGRLIWARGVLSEASPVLDSNTIETALSTEDGVRATEIALRRVKQQVIASSVMELITCGAVPPYRDVLGGKLAAMMMLSGEITEDFSVRYANRVSLIASALAGRPVTRPVRLAIITTSSLYPLGSSQYNRIRIPVGSSNLTYRRIGKTDSFGTVHFAPDTVEALSQVARLAESRRDVNNLFGEGTSPKLRLVRTGLDALGLEADAFLRHHSPRLLYGASLCSNVQEVALGLQDAPKYVLPPGRLGTQIIVEHWKTRWVTPRIGRPDVLERLRAQSFDGFRLSLEIGTHGVSARDLRRATPIGEEGNSSEPTGTSVDQTFIERLYRSTKSYADRLTQDELNAIHLDLGVDSYLLEKAGSHSEIVITGNPGDGKTHLIERLRPQLEALGATVITDANACSDSMIVDSWQACRLKQRPFVLAINEWPLYVLRRLAREQNFSAVDEALRQVTSARFFVPTQEPGPAKDNVVVIDLSLRNLLAPAIVDRAIERLTQDRFYSDLNSADPALANREALRQPQVRDRLKLILGMVGKRVGHITMRQLLGFISFLITGGQPAAERLRAAQDVTTFRYSHLAFSGGIGPLFDAIRGVFDPAGVTHPIWDESLWLGGTEANDWLYQKPPAPLMFQESEREHAYRAIKRRFFFEHRLGGDLRALVPNDEREFERILQAEEEARTGLVRELVLALNRFYEPDCGQDERDRLHLWQSHRYDVRAPTAFLVLHSLPHHQLRIERLKVASWVEAWLPDEQHDRRTFALVASTSDGREVALLEIDRDLYLTLFEAQRGLGRSSWSRTATRRISRFIDLINRAVVASSGIQDVRIRNVESDLDESFSIQRTPPKYQL